MLKFINGYTQREPMISRLFSSIICLLICFQNVDAQVHKDTFDQSYDVEIIKKVLTILDEHYVDDLGFDTFSTEQYEGMNINEILKFLDVNPRTYYYRKPSLPQLTRSKFDLKNDASIGIKLSKNQDRVFVLNTYIGFPAHRIGIKSGDTLTHIDRKSLSNYSLNEIFELLRGEVGSFVELTYLGADGKTLSSVLSREIVNVPLVKVKNYGDICYLQIRELIDTATEQTKKSIKTCKKKLQQPLPGIVIDIRGNPGGLLDQSIKLSSLFLKRGVILQTQGRQVDDKSTYVATRKRIIKNVPIIILVDEITASGAEVFAAALRQHGKALIVGEKTAGAGTIQIQIPINSGGGGYLMVTTEKVIMSDGVELDAVGILPDIVVKNPRDFEERTDLVLAKALEILNSDQYHTLSDQFLKKRL